MRNEKTPRDAMQSAEGLYTHIESVRREKAYYLVDRLVRSSHVLLDVGCGKGYGCSILSRKADLVVGVDIDPNVLSEANKNRSHNRNVLLVLASALRLPFKERIFDTVTSFQVVEHIPVQQVDTYFGELNSVLKRLGTLLISTPNRQITLLPFQKPWYHQHKKEYDCKMLRRVIARHFGETAVYGLLATTILTSLEKARISKYNRLKYPVRYLFRHLPIELRQVIKESSQSLSLQGIGSYLRSVSAPLLVGDEAQQIRKKIVDSFYMSGRLDHGDTNRCIDLFAVCKKL